ncbi:hypothetical protein S40285_05944 [Stachybotrys chlorohalonatus IBT 40285]|uniref:N-acetyltransferase domain-containing protein n=1 Tax=Stachybotrys chlorohalonatus (strain IBT 40285) TaxID=1283841 RepID=A0A084QVD2_STAC4|nr:hypothetical protein S40285_05944 [Stachybotrys chlorohalonata IBT 40285]
MPLQVLPAGPEDATRAVEIETAAYGPNPISPYLFPGPVSNSAVDARPSILSQQLADDNACRWAKVVDSELVQQGQDGMIAFSMWYFWDTARPQGFKFSADHGPASNAEACELFFGGMIRKKHERFGEQPHAYLKLLHTDPAHQRRGAGAMLLKWGVAEADRLGIPSYLEASPDGRPLYEKHEFREVDKLVVDFGKWGGPTAYETSLMLRPVQGTTA